MAIPFCQALAPAAVAAFACAIFRLTIALGGSCCANAQRLMAAAMAVLLIAMPHRLIRPPVATKATPTIMALEFAELTCMPVMDGRVGVLVIVSPEVDCAQPQAFPGPQRGHSPSPGDVRTSAAASRSPRTQARREPGLTGDRAEGELERLRGEVSELRAKLAEAREEARAQSQRAGAAAQAQAELAQAGVAKVRARSRLAWRGPIATLLIVIGCLLAPLSVLGVWTANQVSNTSRYVENVSPLITAPAVQGALTDKISTAINDQINVQAVASRAAKQLTAHGLPRLGSLLSGLSGSIASAVAGFIHSTVGKIVRSSFVKRLWIQGNTVAHAQLVKALSGQPSSVSVSNGKVVIGLAPFIEQVKHKLVARGLTLVGKLPTINPTFPLFSATYLVRAQSLYRLLTTAAWVLPIMTLLLLASGVYVARRHRRALVGAGIGLATSMFALGAGIAVTRAIYLTKVPNSVLPADAAAVIFDTLVRFIKQGLRVLLVLGLVVAIAAFFSGPAVTAVRARSAITSAFAMIRGTGERAGLTTGPVGRWTYRYRNALRIAAIAIAALVFVFSANPTGLDVLVMALVLLGVIGFIELIGRPGLSVEPVVPADRVRHASRRPGISRHSAGQCSQWRYPR